MSWGIYVSSSLSLFHTHTHTHLQGKTGSVSVKDLMSWIGEKADILPLDFLDRRSDGTINFEEFTLALMHNSRDRISR